MMQFTKNLMFGVLRKDNALIVVIHKQILAMNAKKDAMILQYGIGRARHVPAALMNKPLKTTNVPTDVTKINIGTF